MALVSYTTYKLLHLLGVFLLFGVYAALGLWAMNEKPLRENKYEKLRQSDAPKTKPNAACVSSLSRNP